MAEQQSVTTSEYLEAIRRLPDPNNFLKSENRMQTVVQVPRITKKPGYSSSPTDRVEDVQICFDLVEFHGGLKWVYRGEIIHATGFWEIG
jgi:hypothetical protein